MPIRVVVVDDQALVRAGFHMILDAEDDIQVVGEAADGREAVDLVGRATPDVVLMDIRMPRLDGVAATAEILGVAPSGRSPRVLILTTFDIDEYVFAALQAGASGFLLKDTPADELIAAVRLVAAGDALLAPSVTRRVIEEFTARAPARTIEEAGLSSLTEREGEVLALMARGLSNKEIAASLHLGETTVKTHVGRVFMKLHLRDRVQAVVLAYEAGIIRPGH